MSRAVFDDGFVRTIAIKICPFCVSSTNMPWKTFTIEASRVLKCDVVILQTFPFEPYTAAVRTWAKFQIASINESEDREV